MSDGNGCKENICTYGMKCIVLLCGIIGIIFSISAAQSCDFITFVDTDGNPPDMAEDPPFNTALAGSVGIFGYTITEGWYNETANSYGATTGGQCATYEDMFFGQTGYPSLATSQFCVLVAPILAGIGLFANLVDFCVCNFSGSNLIGSLFFISASLVSAGTFLLLADPAFCLEDSELECTVGSGVYFSIGSTLFYFISCLLLFCSPQADPFCHNCGFKSEPKKPKSNDEPQGKRRMRTIDEGGEDIVVVPQQPTTVVVNIINKEDNNDDDDDNRRRKKKKNQTPRSSDASTNSKKKKKKKKKSQISTTSDDVDTTRIDDDDDSNNSKNQTSTTSDDVDKPYTGPKKKTKKKKDQTATTKTSEDADTTIDLKDQTASTTTSEEDADTTIDLKDQTATTSTTTSEDADTTIDLLKNIEVE